eukprot:scaffold7099_cov281-Pinguiococcus_pyrenoidosus.AAC.5
MPAVELMRFFHIQPPVDVGVACSQSAPARFRLRAAGLGCHVGRIPHAAVHPHARILGRRARVGIVRHAGKKGRLLRRWPTVGDDSTDTELTLGDRLLSVSELARDRAAFHRQASATGPCLSFLLGRHRLTQQDRLAGRHLVARKQSGVHPKRRVHREHQNGRGAPIFRESKLPGYGSPGRSSQHISDAELQTAEHVVPARVRRFDLQTEGLVEAAVVEAERRIEDRVPGARRTQRLGLGVAAVLGAISDGVGRFLRRA